MRMRTMAVATLVAAGVALAPTAGAQAQGQAHGRVDRIVRPGQSIQAAIDAAAPGDTILVKPGTYRENLEINKDGLTLRGQRGTRLDPPATPTPRRCSEFFGIDPNPYGICVVGELDFETRTITRQVLDTTVENLTIGDFAESGVISYGAKGITVRDSDIGGGGSDSGYSILLLRSADGVVTGNRVHGSGGAGIYIGSSPEANTVIARNIAYDSGSLGIMVRDAVGGVVERNLVYSNCMGIGFVDGRSAGVAQDWTARDNVVLNNSDVCPGSEGDPDASGVGILLAGASGVTVERNVVAGHTSGSDGVLYAGGIVLASGALFGGTELPVGNTVTRNTVTQSRPYDINLVELGAGNTITHNLCRTGSQPGLCAR